MALMNHCHDCNSAYEKPGTCNCFAPNGKRAAKEPEPFPWYPAPVGSVCPNCGVFHVGLHACPMPMYPQVWWSKTTAGGTARFDYGGASTVQIHVESDEPQRTWSSFDYVNGRPD